jgi:ABC-type multidrug transport system ATPase subunit
VAILNTKLIALGSPAELERRSGPGKTEVQLERVSEKIINAVKGLKNVKDVETEGGKLLVVTDDPESANPAIVETIVKQGGRVKYVTRTTHALEETYLRLVKESES